MCACSRFFPPYAGLSKALHGRDRMGLLIDGVWHDQWYDTESTGGEFVRESAQLRDWVSADGAPGPDG